MCGFGSIHWHCPRGLDTNGHLLPLRRDTWYDKPMKYRCWLDVGRRRLAVAYNPFVRSAMLVVIVAFPCRKPCVLCAPRAIGFRIRPVSV